MSKTKYYKLGTADEVLGKGLKTSIRFVRGREIVIDGKNKFIEDPLGKVIAAAVEQEKDPEYERRLKEWEQTQV